MHAIVSGQAAAGATQKLNARELVSWEHEGSGNGAPQGHA